MNGNHAFDPTFNHVIAACRTLPEPGFHRIFPDHPRTKAAATLIPIVDLDGRAAVVLTQRAGTLDHGGDWVFPGGRLNGDELHVDAARRETAEELGIELEHIDVIGQISTWGPIVTGYVIETFIGVIASGTEFAPDQSEVVDVTVIPIAELLRPERSMRAPHHTGVMRHSEKFAELGHQPVIGDLRHYIVRGEEYLWGMQADMLHEFLTHVTAGAHNF